MDWAGFSLNTTKYLKLEWSLVVESRVQIESNRLDHSLVLINLHESSFYAEARLINEEWESSLRAAAFIYSPKSAPPPKKKKIPVSLGKFFNF